MTLFLLMNSINCQSSGPMYSSRMDVSLDENGEPIIDMNSSVGNPLNSIRTSISTGPSSITSMSGPQAVSPVPGQPMSSVQEHISSQSTVPPYGSRSAQTRSPRYKPYPLKANEFDVDGSDESGPPENFDGQTILPRQPLVVRGTAGLSSGHSGPMRHYGPPGSGRRYEPPGPDGRYGQTSPPIETGHPGPQPSTSSSKNKAAVTINNTDVKTSESGHYFPHYHHGHHHHHHHTPPVHLHHKQHHHHHHHPEHHHVIDEHIHHHHVEPVVIVEKDHIHHYDYHPPKYHHTHPHPHY